MLGIIGTIKQNIWAENCKYFLTHQFEHVFWVLKRTVSLRRFLWVLITYVLIDKIRKIVINHTLSLSYLDAWLKYSGIQFRLPCTPTPRTIFHGCQIVHWNPLDGKRRCPQKNLVWAMWNCMVSMPTHSKFEKGGLPIKLLISQLLLILDTNFSALG